MQILKKILFLLTLREKKIASLLLAMTFIMALIDMIGVASIMPFVAVLTNPILIETNSTLNIMFKASNILGIQNNEQFLFALGIFMFAILLFSLFIYATIIFLSRILFILYFTILTSIFFGSITVKLKSV